MCRLDQNGFTLAAHLARSPLATLRPAAARAATPAMTPGADKADSVDVVHDVEERWIPLRTDNAFSSVRLTADKVKVGGSPPMSFPTASAASRCGRPVAIVR